MRVTLRSPAVVGLAAAAALVVSFVACQKDKSYPPLPNEDPNLGFIVGGLAVGAGPGGTGGSGTGTLPSTMSTQTNTGGSVPANCACAAAVASEQACQTCLQTGCAAALSDCDADFSGCGQLLPALQNCTDASCLIPILDQNNVFLNSLLECACSACSTSCNMPTFTCP
ncbi:MAG TPA: hypothetical protein VHB21_02855 [Minicystis sp.]|nr:hypothetical protein [Minicystis sp.]